MTAGDDPDEYMDTQTITPYVSLGAKCLASTTRSWDSWIRRPAPRMRGSKKPESFEFVPVDAGS